MRRHGVSLAEKEAQLFKRSAYKKERAPETITWSQAFALAAFVVISKFLLNWLGAAALLQGAFSSLFWWSK